MAINIQSLFSDIIETPAQRQERMLTEGILRGRELTSGLTGLARTQAPLVSALSMQMPQRQEALRRGVGGMLGLDVRTESEKLQEALRGVDPSKPESLLQAAQTVGNLGFGAQAAQMRQMAAEQKRQQQADELARRRAEADIAASEISTARTQALLPYEAAALTSDISASEASTQRTRLETDIAEQSIEERKNLRNAMMRQVDASEHLSPREKVNLNLQIQSGGYDSRMSELDDITSNKPVIFGGRAIIKTDEGWKDIELDEDAGTLSKAQGLIASAALQYGPQTPQFNIVQQNILNGNITDAGDFSDYAELPTEASRLNIPSIVESQIQEYQEAAFSASSANARISDTIQLIYDNRLLETGSAGTASDLFEITKNIAGKRDEESFLRTAYAREKNTEIINSLPPGVASDRDIAIFSQGFPPENASIAEILAFLESAQRINSYIQDQSLLAEAHINEQRESGQFQDASMIGFEQKRRAYGQARKVLRSREEVISMQLQSNEITQEEANSLMAEEIEGFKSAFGFVPSIYL